MIRPAMAVLIVGMVLADLPGTACAADKDKDPPIKIVLGPRRAEANPLHQCCARVGGGNIRVVQAEPDTVVFTMTGAVATPRLGVCSSAQFSFELEQCFDIDVSDAKIQKVQLSLQGQVVGLLRSKSCCDGIPAGVAEICAPGHAAVHSGNTPVLALSLPPRSVCCGQNLSVNDREGPVTMSVPAGRYTLHQVFAIMAAQGKCPIGSAASADFSPGDVFKEEFLGQKAAFHGVAKREFGFQVILRVEPETAEK